MRLEDIVKVEGELMEEHGVEFTEKDIRGLTRKYPRGQIEAKSTAECAENEEKSKKTAKSLSARNHTLTQGLDLSLRGRKAVAIPEV